MTRTLTRAQREELCAMLEDVGPRALLEALAEICADLADFHKLQPSYSRRKPSDAAPVAVWLARAFAVKRFSQSSELLEGTS